ncbi:LysR family transcriptional regulator [Lactobacillus sp. ESL0791]|uniref:LysR family transcriptional regulator n=1 Tax=Lactobacillus sp. ESL0791 TaxID=2983234 RepID=UPI0023F9E595|nr:LysR family transcriptional regulator [Lactobacillus sp. ESL0791]MDF7639303.1 LysR family transcriptional regulator [Lactobacillus sp. ESL0791]
MNFEQLLYTEVLSHYSSLQEAADNLHISKSGLSLALDNLEKELGVKIFERTSRGTKLTPDGRQLLSSISDILRYKNKLETTAAVLANPGHHPKITLYYMNTMLKPFIDVFLANYKQDYQDTELDISCHEFESIVQRVRNQEIDAGFVATNDINDKEFANLTFKTVCTSKLMLLCSPENPLAQLKRKVTLADLKQQKFSLFNDHFHDMFFERLQFLTGPLNLVLRVDDPWAMKEAIMNLHTVSFGRLVQDKFASHDAFKKLVRIDIGHLLDDHFVLGWLTNPNHMRSDKTTELLRAIDDTIKRGC